MKYRVEIKPSAEKELLRLAKRDYHNYVLLLGRVESLSDDRWLGDAIKLKAKAFWRVKVGWFRIIYRIQDEQKLVEVVRITRRSEDTYKGL